MKRSLVFGTFALLVGCATDRVRPVEDGGPGLPTTRCIDNDGDGVPGTGDCAGEPVLDCNDADPLVYPGAPERCNGEDDNCNGQADEGLPVVTYYLDGDGDGVGSTEVGKGCRASSVGAVTLSGDCDDANPAVKPGAPELCNGVDDDCDGQVDNGLPFPSYYPDADGDGFGSASAAGQASCAPVPGKVANNTDCDDANAAIKPGAPELCNGVDDDCNGAIDDTLPGRAYYADHDGDGHGAGTAVSACRQSSGWVTSNDDCDDNAATSYPGAPELCNGVDDNCNGLVDDGTTQVGYYPDVDGDGYGAASATPQLSCPPVAGKVTNHLDCDDGNAAIKPGASELCNGVDDNCNGQVDEGNPGGGVACSTGQAGVCAAGIRTCSGGTLSCVRNVAPTPEVCDGLDNDCNNQVDEAWPTKGAACSAGLGVCQRSGTNVCRADQTGVECDASPGAPTTAACDGLDNDCDGVVDEPVLASTIDLTSTAWDDLEVAPYYYTAGQCASGATGSSPGTDALQGGALAMGVGQPGLAFQKLSSGGAPVGSPTNVTWQSYSDIALAQAADGYIVAGISAANNREIDVYYVSYATGLTRASVSAQFNTGNPLDSLRAVRVNGKRVLLLWREAGVGIKMARLEVCSAAGTWSIDAPGCATTVLISTTIADAPSASRGLGADSAFANWAPTTTCTPDYKRRVAISYLTAPNSLSWFDFYEDGTVVAAETLVDTVFSPKAFADPEVKYFNDSAGNSQWVVAYVTQYPTASIPQADLNYWLTTDQTWRFAYLENATENGVASIVRPRVSVTATALWMSALRYVSDPSGLTRQVMTRTTDLTGTKTPLSSAVELSATSGACTADPACRPGNKSGFTNWAPFGRVYYGGAGASPVGSYSSVLTCN